MIIGFIIATALVVKINSFVKDFRKQLELDK